jgi:hypothetical protein
MCSTPPRLFPFSQGTTGPRPGGRSRCAHDARGHGDRARAGAGAPALPARARRPRPAARLAERTARAAVIQNGETKENLEQVVVNHLGNPDQGQVLIQTWVEPDWTEFEAVDIQGRRPGGQDPPGGAPASPSGSPVRVSCTADGEPANHPPPRSTPADVNGPPMSRRRRRCELTTAGRPACGSRSPYYHPLGRTTPSPSGRVLVALATGSTRSAAHPDLGPARPLAAARRGRHSRARHAGSFGQVVGRVDQGDVGVTPGGSCPAGGR